MATNTENSNRSHANPWRMAIWGAAAFLLLLPLVAMQFTAEVDWTTSDFIVFGVMLFGACGTWEVAARMSGNRAYRAGAAIAIVGGFLLVWVNLAVGIIGNEGNAANLMYFGVLAIGIIGACIARFHPLGMARALVAMAIAHGLIVIVALVAGSIEGAALTAFFAALWLTSAALFSKAAREQVRVGPVP